MWTAERVLTTYRQALALYDTDIHEATFLYRQAYNSEGTFRTDEFNQLEQEILTIWRNFTPQKRGTYRTSHVEVGYSSFPISRWVDDKQQPARQTTQQALQTFDMLVTPYLHMLTQRQIPERAESLEDIGTMRMCANTEQYAGVARNGQTVFAPSWQLTAWSKVNARQAYNPDLWYWLEHGYFPWTDFPRVNYPGTEDW